MSDDDLYLYTMSDDKLRIARNVSGYSIYRKQKVECERIYGLDVD